MITLKKPIGIFYEEESLESKPLDEIKNRINVNHNSNRMEIEKNTNTDAKIGKEEGLINEEYKKYSIIGVIKQKILFNTRP